MKRSAGDEDGPGRKRPVRRHVQEGQAQVSAAPLRMKWRDDCTETIWSGTMEFQNGPHSNDQRQDVDIISGKIHSTRRINTDNWPSHLKMTTLTKDDYMKLSSLDPQLDVYIFSVDGDCDKKSHGAFMQYTSRPNDVHHGCALLEYTSSVIQVLSLTSIILEAEMITIGFMMKFSNNDRTVKLFTDLGILPHATAYNVLAKENSSLKKKLKEKNKEVSSLKEELNQKDKQEVELAIHYQEEIRTLNQIAEENSQEKDALVMERDQNQRKIDTQEREIERLKNETEMMRTRCSELENQVLPKKAILGKLKKELQCGFCFRTIKRAITIECGHTFCNKCLDKSLDHNITEEPLCPMCRGRIQEHTLRPTVAVDNCAGILKDDDSSSVSSQSSSGSSSRSSSQSSSGFSLESSSDSN